MAQDFLDYIYTIRERSTDFEMPEMDDLIHRDMIYKMSFRGDLRYLRLKYVNEKQLYVGLNIPHDVARCKKHKMLWLEATIDVLTKEEITTIDSGFMASNEDEDNYFKISLTESQALIDCMKDNKATGGMVLGEIGEYISMGITTVNYLEQFMVEKDLYPVKISRRVQASSAQAIDSLHGHVINLMTRLPEPEESRTRNVKRAVVQHKRKAHKRLLSHERYKNHPKFGKKIRVKGSWVGSKTIDIGDYRYEVLI